MTRNRLRKSFLDYSSVHDTETLKHDLSLQIYLYTVYSYILIMRFIHGVNAL